jgi:Cu/Ag efflux pump CusA
VLGWGSGTALLRPLAIAVSGGFALSALLLLAFLPTLLSWSSSTEASAPEGGAPPRSMSMHGDR